MERLMTLTVGALLAAATSSGQLEISVVEGDPMVAQQLAAAAAAGVGEGGAAVRVAAVEPHEQLAAAEHVCQQAALGTHLVLTASGGSLAAAAAARAGVPLIVAAPAPADAARDALTLLPPAELVAAAVLDVCRAKGWRSAVLLHAGSARPAALLAPDPDQLSLLSRRLPPPDDDALLRNLLLVLKQAGAVNFVVWCEAECALRVLDAAQRVGLLAARHSYVLAALEAHTLPLQPYSHGGANITALMPLDPSAPRVQAARRAWRDQYRLRVPDGPQAVGATLLLAQDAVSLLAAAWRRLHSPAAERGQCAGGRPAFHAESLLNMVRSEEGRGPTGALLAWAAGEGGRGVALTLGELQRGGRMARAGEWAAGGGVRWARPPRPAPPLPPDTMLNRTFTVLIAINKPYVMKRESDMRLSGNERYEGFCIELIERLAAMLGFKYTLVEQADGRYGSLDPATGRWDGMLGRLMTDDAVHFAITDLTMTAERVKAVDFTTPFMTLGIAILFRTPRQPEPALFAFLLPFSAGVWVWLALAYAGASLVLLVVGRVCPAEWQSPYPCVEEPLALENQFTLGNALWFTLGAVLLQGSEVAPLAYGSRAAASAWWLFALIITSSYTANLASLLATKSSDEIIKDVHELANNSLGISYGAKAGGSTYTFFEHAQSDLFRTMYEHMKNEKMPESNELGIQRVMESDYKYAFLMESTSIEYETERNCAVTKVGELLDSKGYGIAMKKNSPYRQEMNLGLLRLQEAGVLRQMKHTWWKERHGGGACKVLEDYGNTKLSMNNFRGLWLVLAVGCALGLLASCAELCVRTARRPRLEGARYHHSLLHELRFVFRFDRGVKPVQGPLLTPTPPPSSRSPSASSGSEDDQLQEELEWAAGDAGAAGGRPRRRSSMQVARHASQRSSLRSPRQSIRSPRQSVRSPRQSIRSPRQSIRSPRQSIRSRHRSPIQSDDV